MPRFLNFQIVNFSTGYFCVPGFDALTIECDNGEIIVPDFASNSWSCQSPDAGFICPGDITVTCPAEPIVPESASCDCDGQLLVGPTCQTAYDILKKNITLF